MDAIIEYASTPEGMLIVVGVAFIGIVLLLTALIFWIGSLLRPIRTMRPMTVLLRRTSPHLKTRWPHLIVKPQNNLPEPHPKPLLRSPVCGLPVLTLPPLPNPSCRSPFWNKTRPFSLLQLRNPPPPSRLMPQKCSRRCLQLLHRLFGNPRQNCSRRRQIRSPALAFSSRFPLNADRAYPWLMLTSAGLAWRRSFLIRNRFPVWMKTQ